MGMMNTDCGGGTIVGAPPSGGLSCQKDLELREGYPMTHVSGKPFRIPCLSGGGRRA